MKTRACSSILVTALLALAIPLSGTAAQKHYHYKLIDMGTFGGPNSSSPSLNASGVTAGCSATTIPKTPASNTLVCGGVDGAGAVVSRS